jgi:hypothetical protein
VFNDARYRRRERVRDVADFSAVFIFDLAGPDYRRRMGAWETVGAHWMR